MREKKCRQPASALRGWILLGQVGTDQRLAEGSCGLILFFFLII